MRNYSKVAPQIWTDHLGYRWIVPQIKGRLKCGKIPSHQALREYIIKRDGSCCWCGTTKDLIADHIISRRNGGSHHPDNLQALCQSCNTEKSNRIDKPQTQKKLNAKE